MQYQRTEIQPETLEQQRAYALRVKEMQGETAPLAYVDTYGCQQNEADSEKIRGMLREMGYRFTDADRDADVIVINTCAIRDHAEKRVLGNLGALVHGKRAKPGQIIAVCGCMVQQPAMAEKIKRSFRHVDLVFGPHVLWRLPEFLYRLKTEGGRIFSVETSDGVVVEGLPTARCGNVQAWLSIMYGCNNFCSYCIVPYVRGRERSREPEEILREARALVAQGYKEITLLGQNVNSYGKDIGAGTDFSQLLYRINEIPGEFTIRFMTSHPKDAGDRLFRAMAECEKVERHLHLPFQAGNDEVLRRMNRGYTRAEYLDKIQKIREYLPDIVLTSDVIVGFPGETEEAFADTLKVIESVRFDALFTFIFSPRAGTPAANMPDPFTKEEKQRRFDRLLQIQNKISEEKHRAYIGKTVRVLIDGREGDLLTARTSGGRLVRLPGDPGLVGTFQEAEVTGCTTWSLSGQLRKKD